VTRQTWTALISALLIVALALPLAILPVPFVAWSPGGTADVLGEVDGRPLISIEGTQTFPTSGQLDLTIVSGTSADSRLTLPEALGAYWLPGRDTLPRDAVFPPGRSADEVKAAEAQMMDASQDNAVVAALRAAGEPVEQMPAVSSVTIGGPAYGKLRPGDLVVSVDGVPTPNVDAVGDQIRTHRPKEKIAFRVLRDGVEIDVEVIAAESATAPGTAVVGITLGPGYSYGPRIEFDLGQQIGGPSAGLVFALGIYDKITAGELLAGRIVAGTGTINTDGDVGSIGGVRQKLASAEGAGATAFLVPSSNCADLAGVRTDLTVIKVATLSQAISQLRVLEVPGGEARVTRCEE
jgi:PDZ domain-containing protein